MDTATMKKLALEYLDELSALVRGGGFDDYVKRDDVEEVDYMFAKMFVSTVHRDGVELFCGISDVQNRYHITVVAQGDSDDKQVVVQGNVAH